MESLYLYSFLPLLIFVARVIDVTMGTVRIIFISKGFKLLSFLIGFVEVMIWLIAINQVWSNEFNLWLFIGYAGGFATGNAVGIWLEEKISLGYSMIRIIIHKQTEKLIKVLKKENYAMTILEGKGSRTNSEVKIIFSIVKRKQLKDLLSLIKETSPHAFYTVEDIRSARKENYIITDKKRKINKRK